MNILSKEESIKLIAKLQDGSINRIEENKLYAELRSRYRPHKIENWLYDAEEMEEEFILASWNALYRAKGDVGDPISFAVRRGNGAMLDYYRKKSRENLIYQCTECGTIWSYDHRRKRCDNPLCEHGTLISKQKYESTTTIDLNTIDIAVDVDLDIPIIFKEIIDLIQSLESISSIEKEYCVKAILNRVSFYDQLIASGKNPKIAQSISEKIIAILKPFQDRFLLA